MNLNLSISFSTDHPDAREFLRALSNLGLPPVPPATELPAPVMRPVTPAPVVTAEPEAATPVAPKRGPGRPRKDATAISPQVAALSPQELIARVTEIAKSTPAPVTAEAALTAQDLIVMVTETMDAVGQTPVRDVFKAFKVGKLTDLAPEKYTAFAEALTEARSLVQQ